MVPYSGFPQNRKRRIVIICEARISKILKLEKIEALALQTFKVSSFQSFGVSRFQTISRCKFRTFKKRNFKSSSVWYTHHFHLFGFWNSHIYKNNMSQNDFVMFLYFLQICLQWIRGELCYLVKTWKVPKMSKILLESIPKP